MRKSKPVEERVQNAGVSLPPRFIEEVRAAAHVEGYETLTGLVRYLLTQWMQEIEAKWEEQELQREAIRKRLTSSSEPRKKRGRPRKQG